MASRLDGDLLLLSSLAERLLETLERESPIRQIARESTFQPRTACRQRLAPMRDAMFDTRWSVKSAAVPTGLPTFDRDLPRMKITPKCNDPELSRRNAVANVSPASGSLVHLRRLWVRDRCGPRTDSMLEATRAQDAVRGCCCSRTRRGSMHVCVWTLLDVQAAWLGLLECWNVGSGELGLDAEMAAPVSICEVEHGQKIGRCHHDNCPGRPARFPPFREKPAPESTILVVDELV